MRMAYLKRLEAWRRHAHALDAVYRDPERVCHLE